MKKIKRTPQYVKNLRRAKGWESWVPTGKSKARRSGRSRSRIVLKTLGSAAKDLVVAGASGGGGRTKRRRTRKKKGLLGSVGSNVNYRARLQLTKQSNVNYKARLKLTKQSNVNYGARLDLTKQSNVN